MQGTGYVVVFREAKIPREQKAQAARYLEVCGLRAFKKSRSGPHRHGICPDPSIGPNNELITPPSGLAPYGLAEFG